MMIYIFCALIILILLLDEFFVKDRRAAKMLKKIPGFVRFPVIGSAYKFIGLSAADRSDMLLNLYQNNKHILKLYIGSKLMVFVYKPEHMQIILNSNDMLERNYLGKFAQNCFGEGLLLASVPLWKKQRKTVMSQFNHTVVNNLVPIAAKNAEKLVFNLKERYLPFKNNGDDKDILRHIFNYATDVLCESYFEIDMGMQESNTKVVHDFFEKTLSVALNSRVMKIYNHYETIYKWTSSLYKVEQKQLKFLDDFVRKVLNNKKETLKQSKSSEIFDPPVTEKKTLLDVLIEKHLQGEMSENLLLDEIKTLFFTGIDTNALTLCYALLLLGMHPEIQEKLYEEVIDVLGTDRLTELSDFENLKYTECVLKEVLRLFPTAPLSPREPQQDVRLDADIIIPKGCAVMASFFGLHRSEHNWPDPLKFDPERFFPENSVNRHPYSWLPFSAGPRNCMGHRFAMNVLKTVLPIVIRTFKVRTSHQRVEDVKLEPCVSMVPTHGFGLSLELRQ